MASILRDIHSEKGRLGDMEEQIPLEGDIVPLEDCEESVQPITTSTLVGKVICEKPLNKGVVKNILTKA